MAFSSEVRVACVVIPGMAHHITPPSNRRERVFFEDADYRAYLALISEASKAAGTQVMSYCLMPNHVHFSWSPLTKTAFE